MADDCVTLANASGVSFTSRCISQCKLPRVDARRVWILLSAFLVFFFSTVQLLDLVWFSLVWFRLDVVVTTAISVADQST